MERGDGAGQEWGTQAWCKSITSVDQASWRTRLPWQPRVGRDAFVEKDSEGIIVAGPQGSWQVIAQLWLWRGSREESSDSLDIGTNSQDGRDPLITQRSAAPSGVPAAC